MNSSPGPGLVPSMDTCEGGGIWHGLGAGALQGTRHQCHRCGLTTVRAWDAEIHDPIMGWFYDLFCYSQAPSLETISIYTRCTPNGGHLTDLVSF